MRADETVGQHFAGRHVRWRYAVRKTRRMAMHRADESPVSAYARQDAWPLQAQPGAWRRRWDAGIGSVVTTPAKPLVAVSSYRLAVRRRGTGQYAGCEPRLQLGRWQLAPSSANPRAWQWRGAGKVGKEGIGYASNAGRNAGQRKRGFSGYAPHYIFYKIPG